jgi:hypothetical protein
MRKVLLKQLLCYRIIEQEKIFFGCCTSLSHVEELSFWAVFEGDKLITGFQAEEELNVLC